MDEIEVQCWQMNEPESPPGAVSFPIAVHGINLRYAFKYTGKAEIFSSVYDALGRALFRQTMMLPELSAGQRASGEITFGLRIDRPGRYALVAEANGQRIAETSFHIRQHPSIRREE